MNATFSFSFGERRRGAPGARLGCKKRFAAATAEAAFVEVVRNRRREKATGLVDMAEEFQRNREVASEGIFTEIDPLFLQQLREILRGQIHRIPVLLAALANKRAKRMPIDAIKPRRCNGWCRQTPLPRLAHERP